MASEKDPSQWNISILDSIPNYPISIFGYNHVAMDRNKSIKLVDALTWCGLCESNSLAKTYIKGSAISVNRQKIKDINYILSPKNALTNLDAIVLECGKYNFGIIEFC